MVGYVTKKSDPILPVPDQGPVPLSLLHQNASVLSFVPITLILFFPLSHATASVTKLKPENTEHITPHFSSGRNWPCSLYFPIQDLKPDSRDCQLTHHPSPNTRGKRVAGPCEWWEVVTSTKGRASWGLSAMHDCPTRFGLSGYQAVFPGCPRTHMFPGLVSESATVISGFKDALLTESRGSQPA